MQSVPTNSRIAPCSRRQGRLRAANGGGLRPTLTAAARGAGPDLQVGTLNGISKKVPNNDARLLHDILLNLTHTTLDTMIMIKRFHS